jgi:hypothetical protein
LRALIQAAAKKAEKEQKLKADKAEKAKAKAAKAQAKAAKAKPASKPAVQQYVPLSGRTDSSGPAAGVLSVDSINANLIGQKVKISVCCHAGICFLTISFGRT